MQIQHKEYYQYCGKATQQGNIAQVNGENIAKQISGQVGRKSRRKEGKHNSQRHPQCPEHRDGRVFAHILPLAEPLHAESGEYGKYSCRQYGRDSRVKSQPDAAKRSMRQSAADEHQPPGDDVRANQSASDACQQAADKGVLEEGVL